MPYVQATAHGVCLLQFNSMFWTLTTFLPQRGYIPKPRVRKHELLASIFATLG